VQWRGWKRKYIANTLDVLLSGVYDEGDIVCIQRSFKGALPTLEPCEDSDLWRKVKQGRANDRVAKSNMNGKRESPYPGPLRFKIKQPGGPLMRILEETVLKRSAIQFIHLGRKPRASSISMMYVATRTWKDPVPMCIHCTNPKDFLVGTFTDKYHIHIIITTHQIRIRSHLLHKCP
jgi:hypothetical protein